MNPEDIVHFLPSEELQKRARPIFELYKNKIEAEFPDIDIQHVGSCAIPGMIGKFDVDIQIRTTHEEFKRVIDSFNATYTPKHPELWKEDFAMFSGSEEYLVDLIVTVAGTRHDDFCRVRDELINNPRLLREYNELKMSFEGKSYGEYRNAKQEFFGRNGAVKFLEY